MTRVTALLIFVTALLTIPPIRNPANSAQPSAHRPLQTNQRGIENLAALDQFFTALRETESGNRLEPVRIMHFGDSHVAADILTRRIRERLQQEFGDGGPGLILPGNPMSTRRRGVSWGISDGWVLEGIGSRGGRNGVHGPLGIVQSASRRDERMWLQASGSHFEIYYARHSRGGAFDIVVDGQSLADEPISTFSGEPDAAQFSIDVGDGGMHEIQIRTLNDRKVTILGIASENLAGGVAYDVSGINGARATRLLSWHAEAFTRVLSGRKPDLIILSYGTNEVTDGDWNSLGYQRVLTQVVRLLRTASPASSFLIYGPPDRADVPIAANRMAAMSEAQRISALDNDAAFWSSFGAMGGWGSMNKWVKRGLGQSERVHLTGAGYARMGDMFVDDLLRAYRRSSGTLKP